MQTHSVMCSRCTLQTLHYIQLECRHHLCVNCFDRLMKSQKIGDDVRFKCEICLKSQRVSSLSHLHGTGGWFGSSPSNKPMQKPLHNLIGVEKLYCFTCNTETFTTHEYLRGSHKGHRVKTYLQSSKQLKQLHLKSVSILQHKSQQLKTKQDHLQTHLKTIWAHFSQTQNSIQLYYDQMIDKINQKRQLLMEQLHEYYRVCSNEVTRWIDMTKTSLVQARGVLEVVKGFIGGTQTIDRLVGEEKRLKGCLEVKNIKYTPQPLPRLEEAFDLTFHIDNSLRICREVEESAIQEIPDNVQPMRRTVKLIEKVRNRLNMTSDVGLR